MDNLEEIGKFLETHSLPKMSQAESENLNRQIITSENEAVIKNLPTNESHGPDGFTGEFYQTFRELAPIFLKLFQTIQEELIQNYTKAHFMRPALSLFQNQTNKIHRQYPRST